MLIFSVSFKLAHMSRKNIC